MDVMEKTASEKRLIDAAKWDEFYQEMTKDLKPYDHYDDGYRDAMDNVDDWMDGNQVEAEPVRHGVWIIEKRHSVSRNPYMDDNYFASATCSECDFCIHAETKSFGYPDLNTANYCPNCGAKMDGDSHD